MSLSCTAIPACVCSTVCAVVEPTDCCVVLLAETVAAPITEKHRVPEETTYIPEESTPAPLHKPEVEDTVEVPKSSFAPQPLPISLGNASEAQEKPTLKTRPIQDVLEEPVRGHLGEEPLKKGDAVATETAAPTAEVRQ